MSFLNKVLGANYDKLCIRHKIRKGEKKLLKDKAAVIEDEESGEKLLKFKSDGEKLPKPSNTYFSTLWYKNLWHTLTLQKTQYVDFFEVYDYGDKEAEYVNHNYDERKAEAADKERMFQNHRDNLNKKTLEAFATDDENPYIDYFMYGILVVIQLGGMYVIVNGLDSTIASAVQSGVKTAFDAKQGIQGASENMMPIFALGAFEGVRNMVSRFKAWRSE